MMHQSERRSAKRHPARRDDLDEEDVTIMGDREFIRVPLHLMDHRILKDGESVRFPHHVVDALGGPAGYRPGYVFSSDHDRLVEEARKARAAWLARLGDAWKDPPPTEPEMPVLRHRNQPASDFSPADTARLREEADQAWRDRQVAISEAWRGG